jgi:hypothetical protein
MELETVAPRSLPRVQPAAPTIGRDNKEGEGARTDFLGDAISGRASAASGDASDGTRSLITVLWLAVTNARPSSESDPRGRSIY